MKLIKLNSRSVFYCLICLWMPTFISSCSEEEPEVSVKLSCVDGKHGHAVDLGLSVNWACCNVGANTPEEFGGYYAWGETKEKSKYDGYTYKWNYDDITKYCTDSVFGRVDNKTILDSEDDVAHVKWGGNWRMPSQEEMDELIDKCSWKWTTYNGIEGYIVTGPNSNSIFLPAAGSYDGTRHHSAGSWCEYWSSSCNISMHDYWNAYLLSISIYTDISIICSWRNEGCSVRPVCP